MVVIKAYGPVGPVLVPNGAICGEYVKTYDPEAYGGLGCATFTDNVKEAMKFDTASDAKTFVSQVPANRPLRADGRPNRPLRCFTLTIKPGED